jgi:hypothetical protein
VIAPTIVEGPSPASFVELAGMDLDGVVGKGEESVVIAEIATSEVVFRMASGVLLSEREFGVAGKSGCPSVGSDSGGDEVPLDSSATEKTGEVAGRPSLQYAKADQKFQEKYILNIRWINDLYIIDTTETI